MKSGKVVVVGDGACGKTCLLEMFKHNKFPKEYVPTVVDNFIKVVKYDANKAVSLALWDTAGQEDYDTIRPLSYQETDLVILCYTIENKKNLDNISTKWLMEIKNYCPDAPYFLVGLKCDIRYDNDRSEEAKALFVTPSEGQQLADKIHAKAFVECSARTGENVDLVFIEAARFIDGVKEAQKQRESCLWCCGSCSRWCCCR